MRVCIAPFYQGDDKADGGIRRVVEAQIKYLPEFGWDATNNPDEADLIAAHGATLIERPGVPMVNHNHGLMWEDYSFGGWGDDVNKHVVDVMIRAQAITAPSQWVAHAISRGMLHKPEVIYHGVDADEWTTTEPHAGYVLWNKARVDPVSDPSDMQAVAALLPDVPFVTTFGRPTANVTVTGVGTYEQMRPVVRRAGVYLATARETFGIGTLEALAAGVPVAGWCYGGQEEIVINGETGYLAPFGDLDALAEAVRRCLVERARLSQNCIQDARKRWGWQDKIAQYAALYDRVIREWRQARPKVSVVVTCYNLARYLPDALNSVDAQTMSDWECLIVDDCSTDDTERMAADFVTNAAQHTPFHYLKTPQNLKLSGARNYGWQHSRGKYVLFLDADDMLAPNTLDALSGALDRESSIHIAYGGLDIVNHEGQQRKRNPWPAGAFNWHAQLAHLNQLPYAAMVRREVLERSGGYRTRDWRAEDASFWSRVTSFGFRAAKATDDTTLIYRIRNDSKGSIERREHADVDGDWTAWLPWRLAGDPDSGLAAMRTHARPNTRIVPFGAQGQPPAPLKAWPVRHFQHPIVSIIIPVGPGHERYLADALDSVQAQTMPEWECVVVNDTGGPLEATGSPWAHVIDAGGLGAGGARNRGLEAATAPLALFLDADDVIVPRALELLLKGYVDSGGRYAYSDWLTLENEARIDEPMEPHEVEEYDARKMLSGLRHAVTALIPTEWARGVGGFDEALPVFEDWDFYCKLAASGYCGVRVPHPLLIYRRASGLRTRAALKPRAQADDVAAYTPLGEAAAAAIIDRFAAWASGEEPIMGCCGGNAQTVAQANEALGDMVSLATGGAATLSAPAPATNGLVRMEFIGDQAGAQSFYGKGSGRLYRAGREPLSRFHDVDPRDVEHFAALGLFRVVAAEPIMNVVEEQPAIAIEPRAEPVARRRVKGRKAD
jgi:glycosyltransferase involved in cell wall biosynthesis